MNRVFISIGPISIYWYSFLIVVAVLIGYNIVVNYSKKINYKTVEIMDMTLNLAISAIIGARVYYVIFNYSAYEENLLEIFMIWKGGLAIYGAIIGGILYLLYFCKKKDLKFLKVLDMYSLSLLLGQAIGRWGNFFNSEAYGGITTYEALKSQYIPEFIIKGMYIEEAYRHPTFLYESIWCLIGVIILYRIRKKDFSVNGRQISFYLIWYGIGRFIIEGLRSDSLYLGDFRISQIVSLVAILAGIIIRFISKKEKAPKSIVYANNYNNEKGLDTNGRI